MGHVRAIVRFVGLGAMICVVGTVLMIGLALLWPSRRARMVWRRYIFRRWTKAIAALLKIRITTHGVPPRAPFFLVANHLSYIDIIVLASQVDCSFIAKADVAGWPVIGLLCRSVGTIFIDRENRRDLLRVTGQVERALKEGRGVVLFPEGTSSAGATVLPFKSGLLELAARAGLAVSYAALSYRVSDEDTPAHLSVCWWGEMTFMPHLFGLLHLGEISATLIFGPETVRGEDRKKLARQLHTAVKRKFIPVVSSEEEWGAVIR